MSFPKFYWTYRFFTLYIGASDGRRSIDVILSVLRSCVPITLLGIRRFFPSQCRRYSVVVVVVFFLVPLSAARPGLALHQLASTLICGCVFFCFCQSAVLMNRSTNIVAQKVMRVMTDGGVMSAMHHNLYQFHPSIISGDSVLATATPHTVDVGC